MYSRRALALLAGAVTLTAGCRNHTETGPPPRYGFVRFENLSGDPSNDWMGRAASEVLSRTLSGTMGQARMVPSQAIGRLSSNLGSRPPGAPGISSERSAAIVAGATRLVSGYFDKTGADVRVSATEEDLATGKTLRLATANGPTALAALTALATQFSSHATAYLTGNDQSLQAYAAGVEMSPQLSIENLQRSVRLDPKMGPAWVAMVSAYSTIGNRPAAEQALAEARKVKLDDRDRASLELEAANLQNDRPLRLAALRKVAEYNPGDSALLSLLAQQETAAGAYKESAAIWKQITDANPADIEAWNGLGYVRAYSGDFAGAITALKEYAKLRPNEANPLDSQGDVHYMASDFKAAANDYLAAAAKQPDALNGGEIYKAAWAKYRAGDKAGADTTFEQFRADQEKRKNNSLPLLTADWLYRTGRKPQALEQLSKSIPSGGPMKSLFAAQLAIWQLMDKKRDLAAKTIGSVELVRNPAVVSAFFATRPSTSVAGWTALADRLAPGPADVGFHDTALVYALILDGHKDAALAIWQRAIERDSAADFFGQALLARLQGRPIPQPLPPNPLQYNEFGALLESL